MRFSSARMFCFLSALEGFSVDDDAFVFKFIEGGGMESAEVVSKEECRGERVLEVEIVFKTGVIWVG